MSGVHTHLTKIQVVFAYCCLLFAFDDLKDSIVSFVMEFMRDSA